MKNFFKYVTITFIAILSIPFLNISYLKALSLSDDLHGQGNGNGNGKNSFPSILEIDVISDLTFNTCTQDEPPETILPDRYETATNGSVYIKGDKNAKLSISLPKNVTMTHVADASGSLQAMASQFYSKKTINVSSITIWPHPNNDNFKLDQNGELTIFLGGTREGITYQNPPGDYEGEIMVHIVYQ